MSKFEFKQFTPTPTEKHFGIAEVKLNGETPMILRFKIVPKKDGSGYFPTIASYKMPNRDPKSEYDECFMLDSRSDDESCRKCVMHGLSLYLQAQQPSVFTAPPPQVQNQSYAPSKPAQDAFDFGDPPF